MTSDGALLGNLVRFPRLMREAGALVPGGATQDVLSAVAQINLGRRDELRAALRATCVKRRDDLGRFEAVFLTVFGNVAPFPAVESVKNSPESAPDGEGSAASTSPHVDEGSVDGDREGEATCVSSATASATETLRRKDFAMFTPRELAEARVHLAQLQWEPEPRRTRRWERSRHGRLDFARWLRTSRRHGGELLVWPRQSRRMAQRPLVILCDVSGSMERYSRMLVHFAHGMASRLPRVEIFLFATRLSRATRYATHRAPDPLVRALPRVAPDWSGGTRIGDALRTFNRRFGQQALRRRPIVLLISDGWDRGDPTVLSTQVRRLQRSCARLIWLNPLLGTEGYEPLTRGMQAALPYVDDFLPAHNLDSLGALARVLNRLSVVRRRRRTHLSEKAP